MTSEMTIELDDLRPGGPVADDVERQEGFLEAFDGEDIYWQTWSDAAAERTAVIALMHGYGEHSGRYHHVATALVRAGYDVMAIDARGHGRSTGSRGYVATFDEYSRDLAQLLEETEARFPERPVFLVTHSNGGLIGAHFLAESSTSLAGWVTTSPFFGLAIKVPKIKEYGGKLVARMIPTFSVPTEINSKDVSRTPEVVARYGDDPLVLKTVSITWVIQAQKVQAEMAERARTISVPTLWLVAGDDRVARSADAERVFHELGSSDRELDVLPKAFHEVLNEPEWKDSIRRIIGWMDERAN